MNILEFFSGWENRESFEARSVIFAENDAADVMYVVLKGEVELSLHGEAIGTEKSGGIFGEMAMIDSATRSATATAFTDVTLARLDKAQFKELIEENPDFSFHAMAALANRLRSVDRFISERINTPNRDQG